MYRVLWISGSLSSVWDNSVHFAKFPTLRFQMVTLLRQIYPILTKLYGKYGNHGQYRLLLFGDLPNLKITAL